MKGRKTFLGEVRGLGPECALSLGCAHRCCSLSQHPGGRWREEGPAPSQEALGVGRACGNDFIGKACDIFSPPVCGSWRKLEVVVISVALAVGSRSCAEALGRAPPAAPCWPSGSGPSCHACGQPASSTAPARLHLHTSSSPWQQFLKNPSGSSVCMVLFQFFFFEKDF